MYKAEFRYGSELLTLTAQPDGKGWKVALPDGSEHTVLHAEAGENTLILQTSTGRIQLAFAQTAQGVEIQYRGRVYRFQRAEPRRRGASQHSSAEGVLTAPMPGLVTKVFVQQGERVEAGQRLLVLEAMKTEQSLRAPFAGVVQQLNAREGELVQEGTVLVEVVAEL
ncbi:MAG: biotin/lipoyl-binding protein [Fimbriimonadales bacterium]|nr:biotin/lipoyl-binding protein [Fimbriimonadales bacterium]